MYSATYLGKYKASNNSVLIEVANQEKLLEDADRWKKSGERSPVLETILESGRFEKDFFFVISKFPVASDSTSLFGIGEKPFTLEQITSLGAQLCDAVQVLHDHSLFYQALDPAKIFVQVTANNIELLSLRKKPLNHELGFKFVVNNPDADTTTNPDDHELERLTFASLISPFIPGTDKILGPNNIVNNALTDLSGWQYATLNPFIAPEVSLGRGGNSADLFSVVTILYWLLTKKHLVPDIEDLLEAVAEKLNIPPEVRGEIAVNKIFELIFESKLYYEPLLNDMPPEFDLENFIAKDRHLLEKRFGSPSALKKRLANFAWKKLAIVVKDSKGRAVKNAAVKVESVSYPALAPSVASTDSEGLASFAHLCSGHYALEVEQQGYHTEKTSLAINAEQTEVQTLDVSLRSLSLFDRWR
jgi:hypothetical protein